MPAHEHSGAVETIEAAPAKINLALHVTGQRDDGYHLLDTLVTFTEAGDVVRIHDASEDGFSISGPFAGALTQEDSGSNLVLKARDLLRMATSTETRPVSIHLEKNLPVSSGIGGGSADAAATLRGLCRHWNVSLPPDTLQHIALKLGADVPMCLSSQPLMARGIGEDIELLDDMPRLALVLVNPLKGVSTPEIFRRLTSKNNPPIVRKHSWMAVIAESRNDLEAPACAVLPEIRDVCSLISDAEAKIVRMSGSGATCFGLFETLEHAQTAAARLRQQRPGWYVQATQTIGGPQK